MKVLVTCGPSWEPIDGARRLTNMSTGRLGADLAGFFAVAGCDVHCLRGSGATCPTIPSGCVMEPFDTNEDLAARLRRLGSTARFDAVFHAAALCDYRVVRVADASGRDVRSEKIATRDGRLILELEPAAKVLPSLRGWFPGARIVGWKYELAGTRADAFGRAWRQVRSGDADATVLNGVAYGEGFAICHAGGEVRECPTAALLGHALLDWLARDGAACGRRAIGTSHAIMPARREGGSL